jgi:hypothetical protein
MKCSDLGHVCVLSEHLSTGSHATVDEIDQESRLGEDTSFGSTMAAERVEIGEPSAGTSAALNELAENTPGECNFICEGLEEGAMLKLF